MLYNRRKEHSIDRSISNFLVVLSHQDTYALTKEEVGYINETMKYYNDYQLIPLSEITLEPFKEFSQLGNDNNSNVNANMPCLTDIPMTIPIESESIPSLLHKKTSHSIQSIDPPNHPTQNQSIQYNYVIESPFSSFQTNNPLDNPNPNPNTNQITSSLSSRIENQKKFEAILKKAKKYQKEYNEKEKEQKPETKPKPQMSSEKKDVIYRSYDYLLNAIDEIFKVGNTMKKGQLKAIYRMLFILTEKKSNKYKPKENKKKISETRKELFLRIRQLTIDQVREIAKIFQPNNQTDTLYINVTQITRKNATLIERTIKGYEEANKKIPDLVTFDQLEKQKELVKEEPFDILNDSLSSSLSSSSSDEDSSNMSSDKVNELKGILKDIKKKD